MAPFRVFRKVSTTRAVRINGPADVATLPGWLTSKVIPHQTGFDVVTTEGRVLSTPYGSWLALDSKNEPYPIAADVFATMYEEVAR